MQERRVREKIGLQDFYIGSLNMSYIQFVKAT